MSSTEDDTSAAPASKPPSALLPARIGRYPVAARLAAGGQADVYRGVHPTLGSPVILKQARTPLDPPSRWRDLIVREGRILAAIAHPHLARVLDLDVHDGRPFLVLEDVDGESLADVCRAAPFDVAEIVPLLTALAGAVQAAHDAGVLHLDLKPENVLITSDGLPRLIDFGTAQLLGAHGGAATDGWLVGTPDYMAPEQHCGDPTLLTQQTDVYGLGGILHFLLHGTPPAGKASFPPETSAGPEATQAPEATPERSPDAAAARRLSCRERRSSHRTLARRLATVCARALATNPEARFSTADDFAAALRRIAETGARRTSRALAAVAAGLMALGAFSALGAWSLTPPVEPPFRLETALSSGAHDRSHRGLTVNCQIVTPAPTRTRLYYVRDDGAVAPCLPTAIVPGTEPVMSFPAHGRSWQMQRLPEFNLLLAGVHRLPPRAPEMERDDLRAALATSRLRLPIDTPWLRLSDAATDRRRALAGPAGVAPQGAALALAASLQAVLEKRFERYDAILFRHPPND